MKKQELLTRYLDNVILYFENKERDESFMKEVELAAEVSNEDTVQWREDVLHCASCLASLKLEPHWSYFSRLADAVTKLAEGENVDGFSRT